MKTPVSYSLVTLLQEFDGGDTELDGVTDNGDLVGDEGREIGGLLAQDLLISHRKDQI